MTQGPSYGIYLMLFFLFVILVPDVASYFMNYTKANQVASVVVDSGMKNGQIQADVLEEEMTRRGMTFDKWSVTLTGDTVDYNEPLEVEITGVYQIRALYALGKAFGDSVDAEIPIRVKRQALGQVYYR